jgi:molybdopterin converting factor subunit 1
MTMQITVKLFALMREKAGTDTVVLDMPEGAKLTQAVAVLVRHYPVLEPYIANTRFSLHMDFVDAETSLAEGDELALIPPVSGGL